MLNPSSKLHVIGTGKPDISMVKMLFQANLTAQYMSLNLEAVI
jgi:hypothetical protein